MIDSPNDPLARSVLDASRTVLSVEPRRAGCVEVRLDCGHVVRRRFGLCVPSRMPCPECRRAAAAAARHQPRD